MASADDPLEYLAGIQRRTGEICCDRYADHMACDCRRVDNPSHGVSGGPESKLTQDVASLAFALGGLTIDIGQKIAPEIDRLKSQGEEHTNKLNELLEEVGRLNRNAEALRVGFKRVVNKLNEHERRLDAIADVLCKEGMKEKAAAPTSSTKNPTSAVATAEADGLFKDVEGLFKDMGEMFKDMGGLFNIKAVKKTVTKG